MKNNLFSKILSFICALLIWIIVYNISDPVITIQQSNIPIIILNENSITSKNKVYSIQGDKTINFYIKGKQSIIKSIKPSDINVTADLSRLSDVNAVKINIEIPKYANEIEIIYGKYDTLKVSLDNLVSKTFDLDVIPIEELSNKYFIYNHNIDKEIKITGAQQIINKISKIYIEPNLKYIKPNYKAELTIKAKDNFGSELDLSSLTLDNQSVSYNPTIYNVKEVDLNINCIGEVPYGYQLNKNDFNPSKVFITGTDDELKNINEINVNYDITGMTNSKTIKFKLNDYIENPNIYLIDEKIEITLTLEIEQFSTKTFKLKTTDISIKNMPEKMTLEFLTELNNDLTINVMGSKDILSNLQIEDINPYVDFKDLSLGQHNLPIQIINDNLKLINTSNLNFELKEIVPETTIEEPETSTSESLPDTSTNSPENDNTKKEEF